MKKRSQASNRKQIVNLPNVLTIVRILLVPVFGYLLYVSASAHNAFDPRAIGAMLTFVIAAATDHLDGYLARSRGLVTDFGKIMDPIADKALMLTAFVLLSITDGLYWWFTIVVIVREAAVTILRWFLLRNNVVLPASNGGKLKTVLQMLVAFLMLNLRMLPQAWPTTVTVLTWITIFAIVGAFAATIISGVDYFYGAWLSARKKRGGAKPASVKRAKPKPEPLDPRTRAQAEPLVGPGPGDQALEQNTDSAIFPPFNVSAANGEESPEISHEGPGQLNPKFPPRRSDRAFSQGSGIPTKIGDDDQE